MVQKNMHMYNVGNIRLEIWKWMNRVIVCKSQKERERERCFDPN